MRCFIERVVTNHDVTTDIKVLIPDAGLRRRMSRVIKSAVTTAIETVGGVEGIASLDGIITATGWGCLADSERFLRNVIVDKEQLLNPTPFIQSTFNTVGGQIALLGHNHCYNVTYVNRSHSFEDALLDAMMRAEDGDSEHMLLGAFDEETPSQRRIMERMGLFRKVACGEGAMFAIVGAKRNELSIAEVTTLAFPAESLSHEKVVAEYATDERTHVIYNNYAKYGLYPTSSAQCFAEAVKLVAEETPEVVIYNEYFGATPTVIVVRCLS
jgi:hypothetical protein